MQLYDRIKLATGTNDAMYDTIQKEQFATRLTEFNFFLKKVEPFLNTLKAEMVGFLTTKQTTLLSYS